MASALQMISQKWSSNENFSAGHFSKVVLGVLLGPFNTICVYLHFPPIILIDVDFLERVLLAFSKIVVPQLVQGKIDTSSITVYGGPCLYFFFNDGYYGAPPPNLSETEYKDFC